MRVLKNNEFKLFEQIVALKQPSLMKTMKAYLQRHYNTVKMTKDYLYAAGDIPVALVSHLDTVFTKPPENVYYDTRKNVLWSPEGLGADDRAGVYAIVRIIKAGYRPHIIFTTDEELGCLGADALAKQLPQPFASMKYIIELDRRGTNDCVFYDCANDEFTQYVESFGFIENFGTYSDICEICPAWKVAGVNLSIGYQNEHSVSETLHVSAFLATIDKVMKMLDDAPNAPAFQYIPSPFAYNWHSLYKGKNTAEEYALGWSGSETDYYDDSAVNCAKCGTVFSDYEVFPVKALDGKTKFYCPDCISQENIEWCYVCGEAYEMTDKEAYRALKEQEEYHICKDCERSGKRWKESKKLKNALKKL